MDRTELEQFIQDNYDITPDYPWIKEPNYKVFRHKSNRKWFALIMEIPKNKLGMQKTDMLDVVNLKCNPILIGSLLKESGFFPAYHMNKEHWITIALDGSVADEKIEMLLDMSYKASNPNIRKKRSGQPEF